MAGRRKVAALAGPRRSAGRASPEARPSLCEVMAPLFGTNVGGAVDDNGRIALGCVVADRERSDLIIMPTSESGFAPSGATRIAYSAMSRLYCRTASTNAR